MRLCTIVGCTKTIKAKGMCDKHYKRVERHGDPYYTKPQEPKRTNKDYRRPACYEDLTLDERATIRDLFGERQLFHE
jgi:hypothetical protein